MRGALFGDKQKVGRKELSDHHAMFAILNEIYKEDIDLLKTWLAGVNPEYSTTDAKAEIEREPLALKTAARKFQDLADLQGSQAPSDENLEVRLSRKVKKIQKEVAAGRFTSNDMAVLEGIFYGNSPRMEIVNNILKLLVELGVDFMIDGHDDASQGI